MSKQNLEKTIRRELEVLNDRIDQKIIKGMSYAREAHHHRFLLASLSRMRKNLPTRSSWLTRSFSTISTFLL